MNLLILTISLVLISFRSHLDSISHGRQQDNLKNAKFNSIRTTSIICQIYLNIFLCIVDVGTKTLVVHGQNECDIPTQLPVHEDTQFEALLKVKTPDTVL